MPQLPFFQNTPHTVTSFVVQNAFRYDNVLIFNDFFFNVNRFIGHSLNENTHILSKAAILLLFFNYTFNIIHALDAHVMDRIKKFIVAIFICSGKIALLLF